MLESLEGQCQCGKVHYRVQGVCATVFVCHCLECQRQSASAFGMALWVNDAKVLLLSGELNQWLRATPSGQQMLCRFCHTCGTRLFHQIKGQNQLSIKPGTLNDSRQLKPVAHIWTSSKQDWVKIPENTLQYPENPPTFDALFMAWEAQHSAPDRSLILA
ncbi:GFA family protein [Undibacterium parvum]|uniref:Aldehyde-activating protein n=1 Tax=Undibacterium parvum TaxID=401471 RepID=A0A3S9HJ77_9BURK|nr:GFA family protein [Undibacterium parvum]AZP12157.1 aldehyde-activating protein [Undibacterium parvum]